MHMNLSAKFWKINLVRYTIKGSMGKYFDKTNVQYQIFYISLQFILIL